LGLGAWGLGLKKDVFFVLAFVLAFVLLRVIVVSFATR
jgi:hypothetical protein